MKDRESRLIICTATMEPERQGGAGLYLPGHIGSWTREAAGLLQTLVQWNTTENNLGLTGSYDWIYRHIHGRTYDANTSDILMFIHDDVICKERAWDERVLYEFENKEVGLVGFGGALRHGRDDIYKTAYDYKQLGRFGYRSNVDDAEMHGEKFEGCCDVAVLDGFVLVVRRSFLDCIGGFTQIPEFASFYCYDYAVCALAHRTGYRIRLVGVRCHHLGGVTSTRNKDGGVVAEKITGQEAYDKAHRWTYETFRDVLPWRCL